MKNENGLEPCPFCGSEKVFCTDAYQGRGYSIKCGSCNKSWGPFVKPETAYEKWNQRRTEKVRYANYDLGITECGNEVEYMQRCCDDCGAFLDWTGWEQTYEQRHGA